MVLSELINKLNESTAGKVGAVVVVFVIVGGVGFKILTSAECGIANNGYGPQVSPQAMAQNAQKEITQLKANTSMPDSVKKAQIAHLQGELDQAQGHGQATQAGPPPNSTG
jgi:hypothetical protein